MHHLRGGGYEGGEYCWEKDNDDIYVFEVERVKEEMEEMKKSLQRRSANELATLRANEESERWIATELLKKNLWSIFLRKEFERSVRERMEKEWTEKETSLRAQFTRERDQAISHHHDFLLMLFYYLRHTA